MRPGAARPNGLMWLAHVFVPLHQLTGSEVTAVVARLRSKFGRDGHYHLLNRNCNHFTQTFATALLLQGCSKMKGGVYVLKTYPTWVNRAANVGTHAIDHGNVCSVWEEALEASGQQGKVGWEFDDVRAGKGDVGKVSGEAKSKKAKKKELTEKQRRALEKIKGGKK